METLAERVDLVRRASAATVEITEQLGAELTTAQGELAVLRSESARIMAELRILLVAHETLVHQQAVDISTLKDERDQARADFAGMIAAAAAVETMFSPGYGRAETAVLAQLTPAMTKALHRLKVAKNSRLNGRVPAESFAALAEGAAREMQRPDVHLPQAFPNIAPNPQGP